MIRGSSDRGVAEPVAAVASRWWDDVVSVLPAWLATRLLVAVSWLIVQVADPKPDGGAFDQVKPGLLAWDGGWYRVIAERGYGPLGLPGSRFFPLFPALGRGLSVLTGGRESWALVAVSNLAALGALVLIVRLVRTIGGDDGDARAATWMISLYPASFVTVWAYSESLMLVGVVGAFVAARSGRWWWAAAAAAVAGASRPLGVLVAVVLAIEAHDSVRNRLDGRSRPGRESRPSLLARVVAIGSAPVVAAIYVAWASNRFDRWPAPAQAQDDLRGDLVLPPVRLLQTIGEVVSDPFGDGLHAPFAWGLAALAVLAFWATPRWSTVTLPLSLAVFSALAVAVSVGAENLNSMERYGLNAVPLLVLGAGVVRRAAQRISWLGPAVAVAGGVSLAAMTTLAWAGEYVP